MEEIDDIYSEEMIREIRFRNIEAAIEDFVNQERYIMLRLKISHRIWDIMLIILII